MKDDEILRYQENKDTVEKRTRYNDHIFSIVAPKYDFITRALSFFRDKSWKRFILKHLPDLEQPVCLDLACGTGDFCFMLSDKYPRAEITGTDIQDVMLKLANERNTYSNVRFEKMDMTILDYPEASFDIITGGYALRNAPDRKTTIRKIGSLLKSGGTAAFLDFAKSDSKAAFAFNYSLLKFWGSFWGILLHGRAEVYGYIAESTKDYATTSELTTLFAGSGLSVRIHKYVMFGMLEIFLLEKE